MSLYIYPPSKTIVTIPPVSILIDGVETTVEIDTANPNNTVPMPTISHYMEDGAREVVNYDSTTAANTRAMPVKLVNPDGSASDQATETKQDTGIAALGDLLTELQLKADLTERQPVSVESITVVDQGDTPLLIAGTIPKTSTPAPLVVIASTAAASKKVQTVEDIGEFLGLYDTAGPTLLCALPVAGGVVDVVIPSGTSLGIKNMKDTDIVMATVGVSFAINLIG